MFSGVKYDVMYLSDLDELLIGLNARMINYLRYFKHLYEMYIAKELLFPVKLALKTGRKNLTLYGLVRPLQISYTSYNTPRFEYYLIETKPF